MYYNVSDHLGSASLELDVSGAVVQKLDYLPFGSERVSVKTGSFDTRFTFTDQERDPESGLLYYGARYYHPVIGRFTQPDPVAIANVSRKEFQLALANPQLLNPYTYAGNNPLKYTDENGEFIFLPIIAAVYAAPYAAALIGTSFVGLAYATKYYAESLGYYSEGADNAANQAIANEMVAIEMTAMMGTTIMAADKAVSGGSGKTATSKQSNTQKTSGQENSKLKIDIQKQNRHVPGSKNYDPKKSTLTHENPQALIDEFAGTGQPVNRFTPGTPGYRERVDFGQKIGYFVDQKTGVKIETTKGIIHYGQGRAHIVPAKP